MRLIRKGISVYESWVIENSGIVKSIEDSLRSLALMLPNRYGDSQLIVEAGEQLHYTLNYYH